MSDALDDTARDIRHHDDRVRFIDTEPSQEDFATAVVAGLTSEPKCLPAKFFYDAEGSALFDQICTLEAYYPTRTELSLLREHAAEIGQLIGPEAQLIEFGAGSLAKVGLLIDAMQDPAGIVALDISGDHLRQAAQELKRNWPTVDVIAIAADYSEPMDIPGPASGKRAQRAGFFPGSTIGNFTPEEAGRFLRTVAQIVGKGGLFILGVDLVKDRGILERAYDDPEGVTAQFNLNVLHRIRRELATDLDPARFEHRAFYNAEEQRIEMHLYCPEAYEFSLQGQTIRLAAGETIHTENSYKYTLAQVADLARRNGFEPIRAWTDDQALFSIHVLEVQ